MNYWKPDTITIRELEKKISNGTIQVPSYQRGKVWGLEDQKTLIDSLKLGYPIGALLMYKHDDTSRPWLLIDGLQRTTAMLHYVNSPAEYFKDKDIPIEIVFKIIDLVNPEITKTDSAIKDWSEKILKIIIEFVKSHNSQKSFLEMEPLICAKNIVGSQDLPIETCEDNKDKVYFLVKPFLSDYIKSANEIREKQIPYIEITGDDESLSDIFNRINSRGKKLDKQNIYAATWSNYTIDLKTINIMDKILDKVCDRYNNIIGSGTKIYNYDYLKFKQCRRLDLFELIYGFGKYLKAEYPYLFGSDSKINKVDNIGFVILNACLGAKSDEVKNLHKLIFVKRKYGSEELCRIVQNIDKCIKYIDNILSPITKFKYNTRAKKGRSSSAIFHADYQIASIIASVYKLKHFKNGEYVYETVSRWRENDELLRKNLLKRYIYDVVSEQWGGHGDSTLNDVIFSEPNVYTVELPKDTLKDALNAWFGSSKLNVMNLAKDIKGPNNIDNLLLSFYYVNKFTAEMQLDMNNFDVEHLFPKKYMEKKLSAYGGIVKLPLGSFGNICLLPEGINRSKKDQIIYYNDGVYLNNINQKKIQLNFIEDVFTLTKKEDMAWMESENLESEVLIKFFDRFITNRYEIIRDDILNHLYD